MAIEKKLLAIPVIFFASSGTVAGSFTTGDSCRFKVLQVIVLQSSVVAPAEYQIKKILGATIFVGPVDRQLTTRSDISVYTVADGALVFAQEQPRTFIPVNEVDKLSEEFDKTEHEEEPTVAKRVILVGCDGDKIDTEVTPDGKKRLDVKIQEPISVVVSGSGSTVFPTTPVITNISVPLANTEQSYALPADTKRFLIRVRGGTSEMRLAFISGDTATTYLTIRKGSVFTESDISTSSVTLYFRTSLAAQTVEIIVWTGGGASGMPATPTITNTSIAFANTEQSLTLPAFTVRFLIRARSDSSLRLAFVSGDTIVSWITVRPGTFFTESDIAPTSPSVTLYFQSPTAGEIVEVISWV